MYRETEYKEIECFVGNAILIVTATDIETEILHEHLRPIQKGDKIIQCPYEDKTYFVGVFGAYLCFHIQCGTMGSIGSASSIVTVRDSVKLFKPKITIMIGIAFGIDPSTQEIGDVIVADNVIPYDNKKITEGATIIRSLPVPTSKLLLDRFRNVRNWEFPLENRSAMKIVAPIFSGEELINHIDRRQELQAYNSLAKGGEMEGAGLYTAASSLTEWILVKGICDYADGNKDKNKDVNQKTAMRSAVSLCLEVFSSLKSFEHIELYAYSGNTPTSGKLDPILVNRVLFELYDDRKEQFYLNRVADDLLLDHLKYSSIWVSGKSGRGKSIALIRNIIKDRIDYISITLASCIGLRIDDFFYEIYVELMYKLRPGVEIEQKRDYQTCVRKINNIIEEYSKSKTIFILIDEIPLGNDEKFAEFVQRICSLFISSALNCNGVEVKYALSSIYSPEPFILEFQNKVKNHIKFFNFENWTTEECLALISIFERELNISIEDSKKKIIIEESNGSPRWIKNMLKTTVILGGFTSENIDNAISQTKSQNVV
ncbi:MULTISPECIES: hypothetical protein [Sphingobacterium]|uniref:5'-methylthioadenosine/S-adenosylhomocysteine nucleosidase family protein n=1 Tax=Sphingobacterium TaxID=28453 RepID=UPI00257EA02C|nr:MULTISPECIES: hypothetical protein [Sphingobacterium]